MNATTEPAQGLSDFWSVPPEDLLRRLQSTPQGLSGEDALRRLSGGATRLSKAGSGTHTVSLLLGQFKSPIILILIFAAFLSLCLGQATDAVDVAKEAADFVLLEKDLGVLERGVREGRATFANTMKYIFMATSANFGNMFSMAGASLFLTFLPLLPKQVLLMNLLTDLPEMTIATDRVDPEMVERPRRWDIGFIRRFMIVFGAVSSIFDFVTFGVLLLVLHANEAELRTGWFVESVVSSALIVLVVRTRRPFYRSRPGRPLPIATLVVVGVNAPAALLAAGPASRLRAVASGLSRGAGSDRFALCRRCGSGEIRLLPPGGATEKNLPHRLLDRADRCLPTASIELIGAAHVCFGSYNKSWERSEG